MVWCCSSFRLKSSSSSSHSFKLRPTCQRKFWSLNSAWRIFKMKREQRSEESRDVKRVITTTIHHNTSWLWIARQWLCKAVIADRSGIASSRCPWQSVVFLPFGLLPIEVNAVVSNVVVKPAWKFQEISWNLLKKKCNHLHISSHEHPFFQPSFPPCSSLCNMSPKAIWVLDLILGACKSASLLNQTRWYIGDIHANISIFWVKCYGSIVLRPTIISVYWD